MRVKVSEATNKVLNWLVADLEFTRLKREGEPVKSWVLSQHQAGDRVDPYVTEWLWAGPIIEQEEIGLKRNAPCSEGRQWEASPSITAKGAGGRWGYGPTPLIASMRCYVASKLGDEVEVPDELCK